MVNSSTPILVNPSEPFDSSGDGRTVIAAANRGAKALGIASPTETTTRSVALQGSPSEVILVVEDDARMREMTTASLRELGFTVLHAESAAVALRLLEGHPDIALMFTDIVMPDMNGRKLADEALKLRPNLKVIFTTGYTRNAVVHNGVVDADVNFLAKPFTIEQLGAKIRDVLSEVK